MARPCRRAAWLVLPLFSCFGCSTSVGDGASESSAGTGASGGNPSGGAAGTGGSSGKSGSGGEAFGGSGGADGGSSGKSGSGGAAASGGSDSGGGAGAGPSGGSGGTSGGMGCASGDYLICEDFEATAVGDVPDGWTRHGDEANVDDDQAHGGARALKLGPIPFWERRIYHDASALGSAHWGRIFYKVQLPVPDAFVHSTLVSFSGVGPETGPGDFRTIDIIKQAIDTPDVGSRHNFAYNVQPEDSGEFNRETNYDWEFDDQWHCAEYHIDAANQSYTFYYDGEEVLGFENGAGNFERSDIPDSFGEVKVGWINYQQAPPGFTAWIDDVAFDDQRIGCD